MNIIETAISIKQPWAYLIASGIKDIENRTWTCPQKYIGKRVLIHASASAHKSIRKLLNADQINTVFKSDLYNDTDFAKVYSTGAIIGSVEIVDCVINHTSIWAEKTIDSVCPLCHRIVENKKEDRQFCVDCRRVLDKGIDYYDIIYNWVLEKPILFDEPITNVKGMLGFWKYTHSISQNEVFTAK